MLRAPRPSRRCSPTPGGAWRRSLQLRMVTITLAATGALVLTFGLVVGALITNGLVEAKEAAAKAGGRWTSSTDAVERMLDSQVSGPATRWRLARSSRRGPRRSAAPDGVHDGDPAASRPDDAGASSSACSTGRRRAGRAARRGARCTASSSQRIDLDLGDRRHAALPGLRPPAASRAGARSQALLLLPARRRGQARPTWSQHDHGHRRRAGGHARRWSSTS